MKASDVMSHFRDVGKWVNWDDTCDQFLHGDPELEVKGIAAAWIPTNDAICQAHEMGCNLFISHEPSFYEGYQGTATGDRLASQKRGLLDEFGITLMRCHDTWDRMPRFGIVDAWADLLGFNSEERPVESYYKLCLLGDMTAEKASQLILEKVRPLGQDTVLLLGDRNKQVSRMAIGTGAITHIPSMHDLDADIILATDDGINFCDAGLWAIDMDIPLLIVNHATAELPGIQAMARYLKGVFGDCPVEYIDVSYPYSSI